MKKLITIFAVFCSTLAFSQSENSEFKVNILYTAIGMPELSYERLISDNSSLGASVAFSLDKKEFFFDLKVFFFDLNVGMVATIRPLWYLPHGCYGTYHTSVMVGTIM